MAPPTSPDPNNSAKAAFTRRVILRALVLFTILAGMIVLLDPARALDKVSLYNHIFPGRERLPYGENPAKSHNMTINSLDAMFASHVVSREKAADEFRVFIFGDSSVWGTLLGNKDTLTGKLNRKALTTCDGKRVVFYNLGYPTISLQKDALFLSRAMRYEPDLIIWPLTLESFPGMNPSTSPLLDYNREELNQLFPSGQNQATKTTSFWEKAASVRRELADWYRFQLYGVLWAATNIDQDLAQKWEPAQRDFENDDTFNGQAPFDLSSKLDFTPLAVGMSLADGTPVWLVNEPILVSSGQNSQVRYNYFFPRWAYDAFRQAMQQKADDAGWTYFDLWNLVGENEFTNSAIHLTPAGESLLADRLAEELSTSLACPQ
jgi:hypothetical protein